MLRYHPFKPVTLQAERASFQPDRVSFHPGRDSFHPERASLLQERVTFHPGHASFLQERASVHSSQQILHSERANLHFGSERLHPKRERLDFYERNRRICSAKPAFPRRHAQSVGNGTGRARGLPRQSSNRGQITFLIVLCSSQSDQLPDLEVTICDLQRGPYWTSLFADGLYRTRNPHAVERFETASALCK
jgi:hypothetical protein